MLALVAARAVKTLNNGSQGHRRSGKTEWDQGFFYFGKLVLPFEIHEWYRKASVYPHITIEPLSPQDAIDSTLLPGEFHRDPADRMIVAMSRRYGAALVTSDEKIRSYEHVRTAW